MSAGQLRIDHVVFEQGDDRQVVWMASHEILDEYNSGTGRCSSASTSTVRWTW